MCGGQVNVLRRRDCTSSSREMGDSHMKRLSPGVVGSGLLQNTPPHASRSPTYQQSLLPSPFARLTPLGDSDSTPGGEGWASAVEPVNSAGRWPASAAGEIETRMREQEQVGAFFIGVTGASASGKTTVCQKIMDGLADQRCALVCVDWFYHGLAPGVEPEEYNFDHPSAFDFDGLRETLVRMRGGDPVSVPRYDFAKHCRDPEQATEIGSVDVIIVEGILTFYDPAVRDMLHMKVFVDEDADVCLSRRIRRDVADRGRSVESVLVQYERFVKPSFEGYILPTKSYADIIVPRGGNNLVAIDVIVKHCALKIQQVDLRKVLPNLVVMANSYQARGLHTLFRDVNASRHDFVFYADRLMRLLIEEGLGLLPFERKCVPTPNGASYYGVGFSAGLCGISLMPGGEAMENSLRTVCANIRTGKMLISSPKVGERVVAYAKLPVNIGPRHVLVMEPVLNTGLGCITAIEHLLSPQVGCAEERILVLSVIASRQAATDVCTRFPKLRLVVSAVDKDVDAAGVVSPGVGDFGTRYFGTN